MVLHEYYFGNMTNGGSGDPGEQSAFYKAAEAGFDVIHAHSPFVTGRFARRAAGRLQVPLVFTHHTRFADYAHYLGPLAGPTAAIFGVGSDGFQGFPTESAGSFDSDSWAVYLDVETDLTDQLSGAVAFRFEDYDDFDNTFDWKVAARYQFSEALAVRGTYNTGFRTPTPGQVHTLNITTTSDPEGNLIPSGTYPVSHPVAVALGAVRLALGEAERHVIDMYARH
jgi:outer membrane receptor protein involved in Fe transport